MIILTSVRAPIPVGQAAVPSSAIDQQAGSNRHDGSVAEPQLNTAIRQGAGLSDLSPDALFHARTDSKDPATAFAQAARAAYIKASIVAGINPLPLSGV